MNSIHCSFVAFFCKILLNSFSLVCLNFIFQHFYWDMETCTGSSCRMVNSLVAAALWDHTFVKSILYGFLCFWITTLLEKFIQEDWRSKASSMMLTLKRLIGIFFHCLQWMMMQSVAIIIMFIRPVLCTFLEVKNC